MLVNTIKMYQILIFALIIVFFAIIYKFMTREGMEGVSEEQYYASLHDFYKPMRAEFNYPLNKKLSEEFGRKCCANCGHPDCDPNCTHCFNCQYELGPHFE